jgi:hypothetical protein
LNQQLSYFRSRQVVRNIFRGGLGIVPEATKAGDMLCLLYAAALPFVLRPVGDNFTLVGECYIQNLMQGDGLQEGSPDNFRYFTIL